MYSLFVYAMMCLDNHESYGKKKMFPLPRFENQVTPILLLPKKLSLYFVKKKKK